MAFSIDFKILRYSIINTLETTETKKDSSEPYSFVDFVKNLDIDNVNNDFVVDSYNKYIIEWSKFKKQSTESFEEIRKQKYVQLLKNIQLNYITQDEERILGNIDYDNPLEVEVAIPFFVEKIKDIIEYYITKRRDVKNSKVKWSTKGSKEFLKNEVAKYIIDNYTRDSNTFQRYKQTYQELSSFQNNYNIIYDGLYDFNDYRSVEFTVDPTTFLSSGSDYDLSSFDLTSFSDYNPDSNTLISELKKDLYKKYISADKTYYNGGDELSIKSTTPFYDPYNYDTPYISRISDTTNLLRDKDIGYYFTSKYIYSSNYFSPYGISLKDTSDYVGILPKIDVYRGEDYVDYYLWSKYSSVNQGLVGKPVINKRLKRFYGYQSRDLNLDDSVGGVERYNDDIQIWGGEKNETWLNEDVFDKFTNNILNRKSKTDYFFQMENGEGVYKYCCDIYGNQFYLIKQLEDSSTIQNNIYSLPTTVISDTNILENLSLLGQRNTATSELINIKIADNTGLGFFINIGSLTNNIIETLADFNIEPIEIKSLNSTLFNTITSSDSVVSDADKKSLFENYYTEGRLVIRDANSKTIGQLSSFLDNIFDNNEIYDELNNKIVNVDIIDDLIIVTTISNIFTARINYNYSTSVLSFTEITKNSQSSPNSPISYTPFYNSPLIKTAQYWHNTVNNIVYFAELSANATQVYPTINYLDVETNTYLPFDVTDIGEDYEVGNLLSIENISRPCVVKRENNLYIVNLIKDISDNYYYQIFKYKFNTQTSLELVYNKVYYPDKIKISNAVLNDPVANTMLATLIDDIDLYIGSNNLYVNHSNLTLIKEETPTYVISEEDYYDNDKKDVINKENPTFEYKLSDLVGTHTPIPNTSTTENYYLYDNSGVNTMPYIYNNSNIELNFRAIRNFSTFISPIESVYKIEYLLAGKIITRHILSPSDIDYKNDILSGGFEDNQLSAYAMDSSSSPYLSAIAETNSPTSAVLGFGKYNFIEDAGVYNDKFLLSPVNMEYLTYNNGKGNNNIQIIFYSTTKKYRFEFVFNSILLSIGDTFSKLELLDARIRDGENNEDDMVIYINSRSPDYVITNSIINI
jgi:hypothetical protein